MITNHGDSISVNATVQVLDDHLVMLGYFQNSIRLDAGNGHLGEIVSELARYIYLS